METGPQNSHQYTLRVYYEDTDVGGVVYYANYLRYLERSRTEMLRERGVDLTVYIEQGTHFVVTQVEMKLKRPARYNDELVVETWVSETRKASFTLSYFVKRGEEILVEASTKMAAVSNGIKPVRIPAEVLGRIKV